VTTPLIQSFFHAPTCTYSYVVSDPQTGRAAVVDPVLDYDPAAARIGTDAADAILRYLDEHGLALDWVLETHAHADHLTAAQHLKAAHPQARVAIGAGICAVQATFREIFNLGPHFRVDGTPFDRLFEDGDEFAIGSLHCRVLGTPGHTRDSVTYLIGAHAFVGDTLFMPDFGTARCDFPGGDAAQLFRSIQRLYALPDDTTLYLCHDYLPDGREARDRTTVAAQKAGNVHVHEGVAERGFVSLREARDATLTMPQLIIPAIQINIRAGMAPPAEANGIAYLKVPLNVL
jgi:glyoxylase-like metal-dependent hydrolase (beta-lactamase superfamily II)